LALASLAWASGHWYHSKLVNFIGYCILQKWPLFATIYAYSLYKRAVVAHAPEHPASVCRILRAWPFRIWFAHVYIASRLCSATAHLRSQFRWYALPWHCARAALFCAQRPLQQRLFAQESWCGFSACRFAS